MGLNDKVSAERAHIGFFGLRNAGKSSVVNAVTGQKLSLVSDVKGTTTDPVQKAMEILPLGPVVIIDTPGLDDEGELGAMRVQRARQALNRADIAVLVVDATLGLHAADRELIALFRAKEIPYIIAYNKSDLLETIPEAGENELYISAVTGSGIHELKERLGRMMSGAENTRQLIGDLIRPNDIIILVTPIDESAPKGRLILPQQQTIRDILDNRAITVAVQPSELKAALDALPKPRLVVTDSQAFKAVDAIVPQDIQLTSFSILFARYKGELETVAAGAEAIARLKDGDTVLISEGCTHHRQCNDIGSVKLPGWIGNYTGKKLNYEFTSGGEFPESLEKYALIVHCGGCMLTAREMKYRLRHARDCGVPITNYGIAIAKMHGILDRSLEPFN